jgi:class 3 adenylate cyclase/CheY-like chemotaxis protein
MGTSGNIMTETDHNISEQTLKGNAGSLLIVDDSKLSREILLSLLQDQGHTIAVAEDGHQALEIMQEQQFDLLLLDIMMPEMNGFQVLAHLKVDRALRHIPVIMISSLDEIGDVVRCIEMGAEDYLAKPFNPVLLNARIGACLEKKYLHDQQVSYLKQIEEEKAQVDNLLNVIIPIGIALSAETDREHLLERILVEAMSICRADGGTLYLCADDCLKFSIMRTDSLGIAMGGTTGIEIPFPALRLYDEKTGAPNRRNIATHAALSGSTINIVDAYHTEGFDFSGTQTFDKENAYRSTSFLTIPLKNYLNQVLGVLQLINAKDAETGGVIPFNPNLQQVTESLASQAAVALDNHNQQALLKSALKELRQSIAATQRFVPREFLSFLQKQSIVDVKLGDLVQQEMTILFADIRSFTTLSEKMTPEENFKFLNSYLGLMEPVIMAHRGFIDKYLGDGIMALFPGCADDAVRSAITMLHKLAEYNRNRHKAGYQSIQIGIGLHIGDLILGTIGGENRMDGTVISDAVNLAARIEGMTKMYGASLLISEQTYSRLQDASQYAIRVVDCVKAKGKSEAVTVYDLVFARIRYKSTPIDTPSESSLCKALRTAKWSLFTKQAF